MTILTVPSQAPGQGQIALDNVLTPYSALWWTSQAITQIPEDSVGWLVAQGWRITDIAYDDSTVPPTPYYAMSRQSMQNWLILQSLLNSWTVAYNDARWANSLRYNQVIVNWTELLASSQVQFEAQTSEHNAHVVLYLENLDTYMTQVELLVAANSEAIDAAVAAIVPLLTDADSKMTTHDSEQDTLLDTLVVDYASYVTNFNAILNYLPADYTSHAADFNTVQDLLPTDYSSHVSTATDFLTGLGVTELARINEVFASKLAVQTQQLIDQGTYSSPLITDITERNTRDKNEAITELNDRLNREKFENQHKLYGQQVDVRGRTMDGKSKLYERQFAMRGRTLDGKDRLYERQVGMRSQTLDGKDRLHGLRQEILRYRIAQTLQNAEAELSHKHKAIVELTSVYAARLEGLQGQHADAMKLMAYQLDERNKLLVGLYGFVERREDVGPSISDLAQITTSLGDAGGGWVTP